MTHINITDTFNACEAFRKWYNYINIYQLIDTILSINNSIMYLNNLLKLIKNAQIQLLDTLLNMESWKKINFLSKHKISFSIPL